LRNSDLAPLERWLAREAREPHSRRRATTGSV
jgi:hypothetical protein